ncbi:sigma-70 family RNA polymerase sigma factor [Kiritimatiellaeota bacterium B1221]|nr:sigma-70 family RNA polymerase sigma factor [Kiritimatiellaeota bacterium B1221]
MKETPDTIEEEIPDSHWVQEARQGDLQAFDYLMSKYQGRIYALLYNMTSNKEDAEDLLQDVFLKAYKALPKFKAQSSFYTWIYRIGVNTAITYVKKRKKKQGLSLDHLDLGLERDPALVQMASQESPDRNLGLKELQIKLNKALQTLSEKHRTVVVLHDIQGLPHHEIGKILGVSSGTVRSRLFYARQQLQSLLTDLPTSS